MIEGIILAAGFSSRANTFKMALKFNNKTIIESCIDTMSLFCNKVYVVTGFKANIICDILKDKYENVEIVNNPIYEKGMFTSVCKGVSNIKGDRFFITPGDYPSINKCTYEELLKINNKPVIIPSFNKRKGHPILIDSKYKDEILNRRDYMSLRDFVNDKGYITVNVNDKGILNDVDTIEDYNRIVQETK